MTHRAQTRSAVALLLMSLAIGWSATPGIAEESKGADDAPPAVDFVQDIQPIFRTSCVSCHGAEEEESGLRLDVRDRALAGGDNGKAIIPGDSAKSLLIRLVSGLDKDVGRMPPEDEGTPLAAGQIALLRSWIDQGAKWPKQAEAAARRGADHWAFQPIRRPTEPMAKNKAWARNPIDSFILTRLEAEGVATSPAADRAMLLRRVCLDLTGLPPSPKEVVEFLADDRADAYERAVDRLLKSPHYGERWGRHWLDLARYADSDGYEKDRARPFAWRYRDWVVNALNADMPFDQFTVKQVAGDQLSGATPEDKVAAGFHRNTLHNTEGGADREEDRVKKTVDRANTASSIWLGLTMGCAQCHSHKYDPITQREYYSFYAFFNSINEADIEAPLPGQPKKKTKAMSVVQLGSPRATRIHLRGDFLNKGDAVEVGGPDFLPPVAPRGDAPDRLDLARWLVDPTNPLTARVTVNRIWQRYFGRGLVSTLDDFGSQGAAPSHPALLDWLASELVAGGWRLKHLHRLIVTSSTYRQTSAARPDLERRDPENILLAKQNRRRVEAEIIRDLALACGGLLDRKLGGPCVRPPQPAEYSKLTYANSAKWTVSAGGDRYRRGLYTFFQRTSPYPMLMTFDSPDSTICTAQRQQSNTPLQALTIWNDPVFFECAQALGRRIAAEAPAAEEKSPPTLADRVRYAFLRCLSRPPSDEEVDAVKELYENQYALLHGDAAAVDKLVGAKALKNVEKVELAAWILVGRTLMNLDEFITKE